MLFLTLGIHAQTLVVNGTDNGSQSINWTNDYWQTTYIVYLFNDAHTTILHTWSGPDLSPYFGALNTPANQNPIFTMYCPFSISGYPVPDISNQNFKVLVGCKRYSVDRLTFVCGFEKFSSWMNTSQLLGTFYVTGTLIDP